MFLFHSQVASARLRGIERPQFIGSSIETLLFGTFFYLVTQRKNLKGIFPLYIYIFFGYIVWSIFLLLNFCPRGDQGFAPTLDPIQSLGYKGLASHSVCFESCCSNTTGMAGIQGLSEGIQGLSDGIQSLYRGQNPSSSGKGHGAFWTHKGARWGHQKASDGHHQKPHQELARTCNHHRGSLPVRKVGGSRRSLARSARCCAIHHRKRRLEEGDVRARETG